MSSAISNAFGRLLATSSAGDVLFVAGGSSGANTRSNDLFFGFALVLSTGSKSTCIAEPDNEEAVAALVGSWRTSVGTGGASIGKTFGRKLASSLTATRSISSAGFSLVGVDIALIVITAADPAGKYFNRAPRTTGESFNKSANFS